MRNLSFVLIMLLVGSLNAYANQDEFLIEAVEYERIIINWNPQGNQLARVLAYECTECEMKSFVINSNTQLEDQDGLALNINELSKKIDWQGTIQTINNNPQLIIKLMLH